MSEKSSKPRGVHSLGGSASWAAKNIAGKNKAKLQGLRFGRLLVIDEAGRSKAGAVIWECVCDCGGKINVTTNRLRVERVQSCGCLMQEQRLKNVRLAHEKNKTHGLGHGNYSRTYKTWCSMRDRALHYTAPGKYKELGIKICERWSKYENFLEDMGERPEGKTLDRIDPYGNYEPSNCRWATAKEQMQNRTNTVFMLVNGKKIPATKFAEMTGLKKEDIYSYMKVISALEDLNE